MAISFPVTINVIQATSRLFINAGFVNNNLFGLGGDLCNSSSVSDIIWSSKKSSVLKHFLILGFLYFPSVYYLVQLCFKKVWL